MWSRNFPACVVCGGTDRKHMGQGMCGRCYQKKYRESHAEEFKEYKRVWYLENMDSARQKEKRDKAHFDGNREVVLRRDNYQCVRCGGRKRLTVHHKDRSGRGAIEHNNDPDNLETICRACHIAEHRSELIAAKQRIAKSRTHCRNGHLRSEHSYHDGKQIQCRECRRLTAQRFRDKRAKEA